MDALEERLLLEEYYRRHAVTQAKQEQVDLQGDQTLPYIRGLFPEQQSLIQDIRNPDINNLAALCSRRSGKSHVGASAKCMVAQLKPWARTLYVALTRQSAKKILWSKLHQFKQLYRLPMTPNNSELTMDWANGSQIQLAGCSNSSEIEKFRGEKYDLIIIDEAGSFPEYLTELVEDVLEPTLLDSNGTLMMIGSPNARCAGLFHDATNPGSKDYREDYKLHKWTVLNNIYIPHAEDWLEKYRLRRKWEKTHPTFMREWLGVWVRSHESMVYAYNEDVNASPGEWEPESYVIGVDVGHDDDTAFVVWGFSEHSPNVRAVMAWKRSGMIVSEVAAKLAKLRDQYMPVAIVMDTGGLGKMIAEEIKVRWGIEVEPAEKKDKKSFIELMNDNFKTGMIEIDVRECRDYVDELTTLQWDEKRDKEDDRFANHCCDAGLYGWREATHWTYEEPAPEVDRQTDEYMEEWWRKEAELLEQREQEEQDLYGVDF